MSKREPQLDEHGHLQHVHVKGAEPEPGGSRVVLPKPEPEPEPEPEAEI